jgi:O-antigen/teichoic acid export membrane protein
MPYADSEITEGRVRDVPPLSKKSSAAGGVHQPPGAGDSASDPPPHDLKRKTARGALASAIGRAGTFVLRFCSMVVLARLLAPADFGLIGMVTACTGCLGLVGDCGLSMAAVQSPTVSRAQTSMLFWINLAVGGILTALCVAMAPILAAFYHEPRLLWVTAVIGASFIFGGAAAQHRAMLQREMRFLVLAVIDISAVFASVALGIGMAAAGLGYWALVGMVVCVPIVGVLGVWIAGWWVPAPPWQRAEIRSMLKYGGTVTLNSIVVYVAYNADKVLLGRFWGAEALGIYGRAYNLINLPTDNLSSTISMVAFPALSRLQNDPERLRSFFLKIYGLFISIVLPITMGCALFAEDIIRVFLGAKWDAAAPLFRLLAPLTLTLPLITPFGCLMQATGRVKRSLKIALFIAPVMILGYVAGLSYGPQGVAAGISITTVLLALPIIFWATRGTSITVLTTLEVAMRPFLSVLIATAITLAAGRFLNALNPALLRLVVSTALLFGVYTILLWFVMGQKAVYLGLLREMGIWPLGRRRKK